MKNEFNDKMEIVEALQAEYGENPKSFYNTPTNKSVEKFWTYNRCLRYLFKLRTNYVRTKYGKRLKNFHESC